jgi:[ribosomal protein S5]-alanine N-acetyltransferase
VLPDIIETARLRLRPFRLRDVDDVLGYATDREWARHLPVPQPYTPVDAEKFLAGHVLRDREVHPAWAILHAGAVVGGINLRFHVDHHVGEMGYSIARRDWGRGLATEAARPVMEAASCSALSAPRLVVTRSAPTTRLLWRAITDSDGP